MGPMPSNVDVYDPAAGGWLQPREDSVAQAEAMADAHLARQAEIERLGTLVRWLDDLVRVPGTKFGIGLDAVVGFFVPVVGDAIMGAMGLTLVAAAVRRGVPKVVIARMLLNLGIDLGVGMIPIVGDVFDGMWRANVRNLVLLERHQNELAPVARPSDYLWVAAGATMVVGAVAAPFVLLWLLLGALF